jgi:transcription elongation factor S-II
MFTNVTPSEFRTNIVTQFKQLGIEETKSKNIEISLYNYSIHEATVRQVVKSWDNPYFKVIYSNRFKSLLYNIKPELIEKINNNEINCKKVAFMTHQELNYEKWKPLLDDKAKKDKFKFEESVQASTDTFTCRRCKKNICTYYQLQTRSSDEAITTFVTCLTCDNRWKE